MPPAPPFPCRPAVPLASLTTLALGGPARLLAEVSDELQAMTALAWARGAGLPVLAVGGGSNLVVADAGFDGLVLRPLLRGVTFRPDGGDVLVEAAAGEPWDDLVTATVARGLQGLECLSGIPGFTGATPIQNVGAYGQEVAETITAVRALDRQTGSVLALPASACAFAYRDSRFRQDPDRLLVVGVTFRLRPGALPAPRYPELRRALTPFEHPTLADVREAVLRLRRGKSMVLDPADPNRQSAGSFFTNPIVSTAEADAVVARALQAGLVAASDEVPRYPTSDGRVKLAAAWLIERAGIGKGLRRGPVGVSTNHTLALVHHGGGTTAELLALAREVRAAVHTTFGVTLTPEPVLVGVTL